LGEKFGKNCQESGTRGAGFDLPPKKAIDLNIRSTGVLECWSNGKNMSQAKYSNTPADY